MQETRKLVVASVLAAGLLALGLAWSQGQEASASGAAGNTVELHVRAVIGSEDGELNAVMLVPEAGDPILPVFVEPAEAAAIVARLKDEEDGTPHPADAVRSMMDSLGGTLERVSIEDIEPLASQGRLYLSQGNKRFDLPASGAICIEIAIVEKVPLVVDREMLERLGVTREELERMGPESEPEDPGPERGSGRVPL